MIYYYDFYGNLTTPSILVAQRKSLLQFLRRAAELDGRRVGVHCAYASEPPVAPSLGTIITSRAFFKRLGVANTTWLYAQAPTNPTLEMYKDQVWDGPVDLANPDTAADLAYLTTLAGSPVTADVVNTILTAPVLANEVPG